MSSKPNNKIPKYPVKLPGSFWGLTTFFNPCGYDNKLENYKKFRKSSKKQGLNLLCVELASGDNKFELNKDDCDILIQVRTKDVLWQKERLLNIGLEHLPDDCDKIAWLDADIIFYNDNWIDETSKLLESYVIIQPYTFASRLHKEQDWVDFDKLEYGYNEGYKFCSMAYKRKNFKPSRHYLKIGHTGLVWAGRKSVFDKHGFYDRLILGGGDLLMGNSFYNNENYYYKNFWSEKMIIDTSRWMKNIYLDIKGSAYYVKGNTAHLFHGAWQDRLYQPRKQILKKYNFDPLVDIKLDNNNCWTWATDKNKMHKWIKKYFWIRNEQGTILREPIVYFYYLKSKISNWLKIQKNNFIININFCVTFIKIKVTWIKLKTKSAVMTMYSLIHKILGIVGRFLNKYFPKLYILLKGKNER